LSRWLRLLLVWSPRYGGGDDIRFSRVILSVGLPSSRIPPGLRKRVVDACRQAISTFRPSPPRYSGGYHAIDDPPIVRLDYGLELDDEGSQLTWDLKFTMLSHVSLVLSAPLSAVFCCEGFSNAVLGVRCGRCTLQRHVPRVPVCGRCQ
jgi:hypothetical protein